MLLKCEHIVTVHRNFLSILFLILCGSSQLALANTVIPFELINGLIVVNAEVNGEQGNYIIDSGANGILLNLSTTTSETSFQSVTSTIEGAETKIKSVRVGDFEANELFGFSTDLTNLEVYIEKDLAGILGTTVFTPNLIVFDFEKSQIIISNIKLTKADVAGKNKLSFEIIEDLPIVDLSIQGKKFSFILDSGASSHFIDKKVLTSLAKASTGRSRDIVTASKDIQVSDEYTITECNVGQGFKSLDFFEKDFTAFSTELGKKVDGLLSLSKLSSGKVYFDASKGHFYF